MARILVVDDEPRIVSFISRALSAEGLGVDSAHDGIRGLELARSRRYELVVLQYLMRKAGEVCTREELLADVWGYSFDPGSNVVDVYVGRLRSKLGSELIETVRNVGYRFEAS